MLQQPHDEIFPHRLRRTKLSPDQQEWLKKTKTSLFDIVFQQQCNDSNSQSDTLKELQHLARPIAPGAMFKNIARAGWSWRKIQTFPFSSCTNFTNFHWLKLNDSNKTSKNEMKIPIQEEKKNKTEKTKNKLTSNGSNGSTSRIGDGGGTGSSSGTTTTTT
jgi:hypothetical protein